MAVYIPTGAGNVMSMTLTSIPTTATGWHITLMCWFKLNPVIAVAEIRNAVMLASATPAANFAINTFTDGQTMNFATGATNNTGPLLNLDTWYHAAYVMSATSNTSRKIYGYLNGQLVVATTNTDTFVAATRMYVGAYGTVSNALDGHVRDVRMWMFDMNGQDVWNEYKSRVPVRKAGLYSYTPFDTNLVRDESNGRRVWTTSGACVLDNCMQSYAWPRQRMNTNPLGGRFR